MENQPFVENQPVLTPPNPKKFPTIVAVIISVVVTAAIVGGGVYFWQSAEIKTVQDKLVAAQSDLASAGQSSAGIIASLQTEITQLEAEKGQVVTSSDEYVALMDQLKEANFKLAVLNFWQVSPYEVFRDPQNKNKFYFVNSDSSGFRISVYDFDKDNYFQKNGVISIPEGVSMLFNQKLGEQREFRGVGIIDNKFVFAETSIDDSPGPCFSNWFYRELSYIDLGVANPTKKSYTLSEEQKAAEQKKVDDCQNSL